MDVTFLGVPGVSMMEPLRVDMPLSSDGGLTAQQRLTPRSTATITLTSPML